MVGLRRAEIDQLEWTAFDWQLEKLHIGVTEHFAVKSQGSIGDVDLDRELMEKAYPQPGSQKPGCGFPVMKLVGLFCLASGALLELLVAPAEG